MIEQKENTSEHSIIVDDNVGEPHIGGQLSDNEHVCIWCDGIDGDLDYDPKLNTGKTQATIETTHYHSDNLDEYTIDTLSNQPGIVNSQIENTNSSETTLSDGWEYDYIEVEPFIYSSERLEKIREHLRRLSSEPMRMLADKLVVVPLIIDGKMTPSVCSQTSSVLDTTVNFIK